MERKYPDIRIRQVTYDKLRKLRGELQKNSFGETIEFLISEHLKTNS